MHGWSMDGSAVAKKKSVKHRFNRKISVLQERPEAEELPLEYNDQIHVLDVCHTPDERLLEFPKDIATMFLTIKYRENLPTLKKVLKTILEIENIEEDTYDVMWNFLDKRMLELKENVQNEDGGINMCGAVDQMIAEGMERGLEQGMERVAQEKVWGIRNMIEVCQELGGTYDNTQFQVEMRYHLSQEEAGKYMKQYWK